MNNDLGILQTLSAMAKLAERRHTVIAKNIANADTPNYKAKDLPEFSEVYNQSKTRSASLADLVGSLEAKTTNSTTDPNGNSVSLEEQMFAASKAAGDHDKAILFYRKTLDMLKMSLGKNI